MRRNILADTRLFYVSRQGNLDIELRQAMEEGRDAGALLARGREIFGAPPSRQAEAEALAFCETLRGLPLRPDYPYQEPESLADIIALFPPDPGPAPRLDGLGDRLRGALLGRIAGCLLGQPVECWPRARILGMMEATGNAPLRRYFSSDIPREVRERFGVEDEPGQYGNPRRSWINNIQCAPEDDDLNYTLLALEIMEQYGPDFTPEDVCEALTLNVPVFLTCTAERVAYKNIVNGILPPLTAVYGNPYREWLGAQIRVDGYSYAFPGRPREAAKRAVVDASVTHARNGVYAAAFCAALISLCATAGSVCEAVAGAMAFIPPRSRLREALEGFLDREAGGMSDEQLIRDIHARYDEADRHDWCHVIPNDMIILLALLRGDGDFSRTVGLAVESGFDTDCNAATAGSAFGMLHGEGAIPGEWVAPLNGSMISRIGSGGRMEIASVADRFLKLAKDYSRQE